MCDSPSLAGLSTLTYADDELMSLDFEPGAEIAGRYVLVNLIGEGGMGTVWAAEDTQSGDRVALKFMKGSVVTPDQQRRFMREARAAGAVDHEAVVEVLDVVELEEGSPVIVMEHLEGESLAERLDRYGRLPLQEVATIMQTVVSAVGTAHAVGIVHRDLKPENIFLAEGEGNAQEVKVLDFGIAKLTALDGEAAQSTSLTGSGTILGTPHYMAPEQMFGEKDIDHRADIWAIGVMLYEALSGVLPTQADNVGQVLKLVLTSGIRPLEELAPELPEPICEAVGSMLSRQREERPEDLRQTHALLERYSEAAAQSFGQAVTLPPSSRRVEAATDGVEPPSVVNPFADTAHVGRPKPKADESAPRQRRSIAVVVVLASLAGVAWLGMRPSAELVGARADTGGPASSLAASSLAAEALAGTPSSAPPVGSAAPSSATSTAEPPPADSAKSSSPSRPTAPATTKASPPAKATAEPSSTTAPGAPPAPSSLRPEGWE